MHSFSTKIILVDVYNDLKYLILYILLIVSVLSTSALVFLYLENGYIGIERIILLPSFLISTSVVLGHSLIKYSLSEERSKDPYFRIWSFGLLFFMLLIIPYIIWNNYSKEILVADFYWDAGITLKFRENGTFRAENSDWLSGSVSYGKYTTLGSHIILRDEVRLGYAAFKDTLSLNRDSTNLIFQLDTIWKSIEGGDMTIKENLLFK